MLDIKNYKEIKTSFIFLDETGLINSSRDKYFALGIISCEKPHEIYNKIRLVRHKYHYTEELKWHNIDRKIRFKIAMEFYKIFETENAKFHCMILDKDELDFKKYFNNDLYKVYRNFSIALLKFAIGNLPSKIYVVLADNYFSPQNTDMEEKIKEIVNDHYERFIIAGVCQIDSCSSDMIQLTDLILGSILYDLKRCKGIIATQNSYKRKFLNFLHQKLGIKKSFFENDKGEERSYLLPGKIKATIFDYNKSRRKIP